MKTVSLELSKELKKAGYPQEGQITWVSKRGEASLWNDTELSDYTTGDEEILCISLTADEILDQCKSMLDVIYFMNPCWSVEIGMFEGFISPKFEDESLANAVAKMWLYLKKEGLL